MNAAPSAGARTATPRAFQRFDALTVPLQSGTTLIEASAGTGKTFAITRLVLRLLLEEKVKNLSEILVVTFTVKATQELVTRLRAVLRLADRVWRASQEELARFAAGEPEEMTKNTDLLELRTKYGERGGEIIAAALQSLDDLSVSTIHGFCQRVLAESALESGTPFRTTFIEDASEPLVRAAHDWVRMRLVDDDEAADLVVQQEKAVDEWIRPFLLPYRRQRDTELVFDENEPSQALVADFVETVDERFDEEKTRRHLLGFDDLLHRLASVLVRQGPNGLLAKRIRSHFSAALIDEFQDTDRTQFDIFTHAFAGCPLFLIGDPKQSIFGFRGADVHAYLAAAALADHRYTLLQNFRSTPSVVGAVEALFTRADDPFHVPESDIGFPRVTAAQTPAVPGGLAGDGKRAMEWRWVPGDLTSNPKGYAPKEAARDALYTDVCNEIVRLSSEGLPLEQMAVLVRANSEARALKRRLDEAGVPSVIGGDADVLESEEAAEIMRLSAAIAAPLDSRAIRAAMTTRLWGCSAEEVRASLESTGEAAWNRTVELFRNAAVEWRIRGASVALGDLIADRGALRRLLALPDGERRMTNVRHLLELVHDAWAVEGLTADGVTAWMMRERTVSNTPERRELRLETDSAAVQILTIHKAKGLEFDVVFCPTLWNPPYVPKLPFKLEPVIAVEGEHTVLDLGSAQHARRSAAASDMQLQEALRLTYVALTRAKHRLYIGIGAIGRDNDTARSALGYLLRSLGSTANTSDDSDTIAASLQQLVHAHPELMAWRQLQPDARLRRREVSTLAPIAPPVAPLVLAAGQLESWRTTSFTALTADAHSATNVIEQSRDVSDNAFIAATPLVPVAPSAANIGAAALNSFPAGAKAGVALHELFEHLDYRRVARTETGVLVQRVLAQHGLLGDESEAPARVRDVCEMLRTVCSRTVPGTEISLSQFELAETLREWRFDLSLASASTRRISDVFAAHGSPHAQEYAPRLRTLRDSQMSGYLNGVIDLVVQHDARWWIVDWKSNRLGESLSDYSADAVSTAMMNGHYTLQYHLYLLALHRHLRLRQPGYDPAVHLGGTIYVFLRGVTKEGDSGWFVEPAQASLVAALDDALGTRVPLQVPGA